MNRIKNTIYKLVLLIFFLASVSSAQVSVSLIDNGCSVKEEFNVKPDTTVDGISIIGDDQISSSLIVNGSGDNEIRRTASNQDVSVSSSIDSTGALSSTASSYVSPMIVQVGQNLQAIGQSDSSVLGTSGSVSSAQNAGVLEGYMTSSQMITAGSGKISTLQATNLAGALGYVDGVAQSTDNTVHLTGGLNGVGGMSGFLGTTASEGVSAVGSFQADCLDSKAYSAVESTSAKGDAYSYLSSADHMEAIVNGGANGHVISNQELDANGDVKVYASSTSDDSSSETYDVEGDSVSGSMSASAGSPAVIDTDLSGDIQEAESSFIPTPGSWVWNGFGGILTSNPFQLLADDGQTHIFAKGTDNGLWDNVDGDWQGLGGVIDSTYSDPFALQDEKGDIHILVKGSDGALWDRVYNGGWWNLGGTLTSNPSAAFELGPDGYMYIVVRGTENALWSRELNTVDMSGGWYFCDGILTSDPKIIFDGQGNLHTFVRGSDSALWDLNLIKKDDHFYEGVWKSHGGIITSDTIPVVDPFNPNLIYTSVRGSDMALWYNTLDTTLGTSTWTGLGGLMEGNPAPVVDTNGVLHNFVQGSDRQLWDNAGGTWYDLDGYLKSSPNAIRDKEGKLHVAVVSGDNGLWVNTVGIDATPTTLVGSFACDYSKIQSAVDEISAGGIVKVLGGTYNENVQIDKSLTVKGAGKANTIVNGQLAGSVFTIGLNNPSAQVNLLDMTIENGIAQKGGGILNKGTLGLTGILLTDNSATNGGGVYNDGGTVYLKDVSITENAAANGGGLFSTNSHVTFDGTNVLVTANRATQPSPNELSWYQGWGVYINSGIPTTTGGFNPTQVTGNILVPVT
jgi:hypothetical protein